MLYLHFALILVTILKLCSALKFRTSICVYTKLLPILGHFLHFDPPNNLKNQSFEKILKKLEDIIILHLHTTNDDDMMYSYWDTERNRQNFLSFWTIFALSPPSNLENHNFEKIKKMPVDIIILHICICHKWKSYDIWSMEHNRHNFLSFWNIFCLFTPLTTKKIKILKKWKKPGNIISSYKCIINDNHMMYDSWGKKCNRIFCHFGSFFALLPH